MPIHLGPRPSWSRSRVKVKVIVGQSHRSRSQDEYRGWRCFIKHKPHAGRRNSRKCRCCPWWPWPLTLTFKLVRAMDHARLPREFGTNPFRGSRDISYIKSTDWRAVKAPKTGPSAVHCVRWNVSFLLRMQVMTWLFYWVLCAQVVDVTSSQGLPVFTIYAALTQSAREICVVCFFRHRTSIQKPSIPQPLKKFSSVFGVVFHTDALQELS